MSDCLFCKIAEGQLGTNFLYENQQVVAFHDINPQAPIHILVIPKKHISSIAFMTESDRKELLPEIFSAIDSLVKELNLDRGFRIVNNCGADGGQTIHHIHFHILAGKQLASMG